MWDNTSDVSGSVRMGRILCSQIMNMGIWIRVMTREIAQRIRRAKQDLIEIESGTGERSWCRIGTLM